MKLTKPQLDWLIAILEHPNVQVAIPAARNAAEAYDSLRAQRDALSKEEEAASSK